MAVTTKKPIKKQMLTKRYSQKKNPNSQSELTVKVNIYENNIIYRLRRKIKGKIIGNEVKIGCRRGIL